LDDVLAQIHADHGEEVTIVSAELMRSGGVAGFFSRETYEVTVELVDPLPEAASASPAVGEPPPASPTPSRSLAADLHARLRAATAAGPLSGPLTGPPNAELTSAIADDEPLTSSANGQRFADLLAAMIEDRVELTPGDLAAGQAALMPEPESAPPIEAPAPPAPPAGPAAAETPEILPYQFEEIDRVDLTSRPTASTPTASTPTASSPTASTPTNRVPLLTLRATETSAPVSRASALFPAAPDSSLFGDDADRPEPDELVGPGPRSIAAIIDAVSTWFRPAPPTPAEGLITVIGGRTESARVALALAARMGQTANDVLIAELGESEVSAEQMAELVTEAVWQRRSRNVAPVSIVVVVVAPGLEGHRWATRVLDGLNSNQIRLAIGGWRPLDRLEQTIAGLGRVDAIDLVDSDAVADPCQLLALPVPVATIDERPATAALWGGLLAAAPSSGSPEVSAARSGSLTLRADVPPTSEIEAWPAGIGPSLATLR